MGTTPRSFSVNSKLRTSVSNCLLVSTFGMEPNRQLHFKLQEDYQVVPAETRLQVSISRITKEVGTKGLQDTRLDGYYTVVDPLVADPGQETYRYISREPNPPSLRNVP